MQRNKIQVWKYLVVICAVVTVAYVVVSQQGQRRLKKEERLKQMIEKSVQEQLDRSGAETYSVE